MPSRRLQDLHPIVAGMCRTFQALCKDKGIDVRITSTLRTEAEQLALFAQGRKSLREVNALRAEAGLPPITEKENKLRVTNSLTSLHQFGCAFDVVLTPLHPPLDKGGTKEGLNPPLDKGGHGGLYPLSKGRMEGGVTYDIKADINKNQIPDYEELGRIGESVGLTWGGRFKFRDYCHFQYTGGLTLAELRGGSAPCHIGGRAPADKEER